MRHIAGIIASGLVFWVLFGSPKEDIATWVWGYDAAPWESVDAIYYPDRSNLRDYKTATGLPSADQCRAWVNRVAREHDDLRITRGDYQCGIREAGSSARYRTSTR